MKKLTIATLVLSLLAVAMTLPERARAASSCAIPFSLTNGTTADATQVMANFNALASCVVSGLFAGAVVAGSNSAPVPVAGDVWASRSATSGQLNAGGSSSSGTFDYGVTATGETSIHPGTELNLYGPVLGNYTGTSTLGNVPAFYSAAGGALGTTVHGGFGGCTMVASTTCTVTLNAGFTSISTYVCWASWVGGNFGQLTPATSTFQQVIVTASASNSGTVNVGCVGS